MKNGLGYSNSGFIRVHWIMRQQQEYGPGKQGEISKLKEKYQVQLLFKLWWQQCLTSTCKMQDSLVEQEGWQWDGRTLLLCGLTHATNSILWYPSLAGDENTALKGSYFACHGKASCGTRIGKLGWMRGYNVGFEMFGPPMVRGEGGAAQSLSPFIFMFYIKSSDLFTYWKHLYPHQLHAACNIQK